MAPDSHPASTVPPDDRDPVVEAYKRDIDRSLLRENLERTPTERVLALMELQRLAQEAARAGRAARAT
jgi:hypothetical protein